jgi:ankyrin repeat protein
MSRDQAVEIADLVIVKELLTARLQFGYECPSITVYTLRLAILRGDIEMFDYLMQHPSCDANRIHSQSWILVEAAAFHKDPRTFQAAMRHGLDVSQRNNLGRGSALAAAVASNHIEIARQLHYLGADPDILAVGIEYRACPDDDRDVHQLRSIEGMAALHVAVVTRNLEMVNFMISIRANVNQCCDTEGWWQTNRRVFPIQIAAYHGNEVLVRRLLDADANADALTGSPLSHIDNCLLTSMVGRCPLRIALEEGKRPVFQLLLDRGARLPATSDGDRYWNPLISAMHGGDHQLVRGLCHDIGHLHRITGKDLAHYISDHGCARGVDSFELGIIAPEDLHCPEMLCAAVQRKNVALVYKILNSARTRSGELPPRLGATGFAFAIRHRVESLYSVFLDAGIKPYEQPVRIDCRDYAFGVTPLECALAEATHVWFKRQTLMDESEEVDVSERLFDQLIEVCDPPDISSIEYGTWRLSMFCACTQAVTWGRFAALNKLISKGVNLNWVPDGRETLLQCAISNPNEKGMANHLLDLGVNPDPPPLSDFFSSAPIQDAAENNTGILERLIRENVDVNTKPMISRGATALQRAAASGNFENLKLLLQAGANVNDSPGKYNGRTAIEAAAEHGRLNMVRYLLEAGADVRGSMNTNYRRTIYRAWEEGHRTLVRMVQDWKQEKYGQDDCELTEVILDSMTFN